MMEAVEAKEFPIEEEYKKNHGVTPEDVMVLRKWLQTQPHLPEQHITDLDLVLAYHSCNRSTEVTKQTLDLNFTFRTKMTEYFQSRTLDSNMTKMMNAVVMTPLGGRSRDGNAVFYSELVNTDLSAFSCTDGLKAMLMIIDLWQYEEGTWPALELVINFANYTFGHITKIDLRSLQLMAFYLQEAIPLKVKHIHLINASSIIDRLLAMVKPFLNSELLNSIHIYSDGIAALHSYIPAQIFPKDVGGEYKTVSECKDYILMKLRDNAAFFATESKKRVSEELRQNEQRWGRANEHLVYGSFKKLDID
ncbi:clavesin-2-like isoform X1 [Leptidea sinapis]|uniref:clavesin-2-like isoform X1 n=1 Tax=Leptidea sinapis TaxID=189913 RepID=UPI002144F29B|nr:clavesin-2-like isoform X1 [Leptidea sinapis]XP_050672237.1 clavesin-2-like isoform X1 [Leptidea sinapis]